MSSLNIKWFSLMVIILIASCARRPISVEKPEKLEKRKLAELIDVMDSLTTLRPSSFYTKIKCNFSDTNRRISFKTSIRCVRDSIINPIITYAGIPLVNSIIRPDSLIISNRKDKCVIRTNMDFIKESFSVDFDYKNVEELLLGLPVAYDTTQRYFLINDPYNYIISSHKKRVIKREIKNKPDRDGFSHQQKEHNLKPENDVLIRYFIDPSLKSIKRLIIDSPEDTTHITVDYLSRDTINNNLIPREVVIDIVTARNHIVLTMDYDKTEINMPQEIYFVIPEEYGECDPKK